MCSKTFYSIQPARLTWALSSWLSLQNILHEGMCVFQPSLVFEGPALGFWEFGTGSCPCQHPHSLAESCPEAGRLSARVTSATGEGQGFPLTVKALAQASWLVGCLVLLSFRVCFCNSHLDEHAGQREKRLFLVFNSDCVRRAV